jgi:hypothetical protein
MYRQVKGPSGLQFLGGPLFVWPAALTSALAPPRAKAVAYPLRQRLIAKSRFRPAKDDNKNNQRAEIEVGLRLIGSPPTYAG